MNSTVFGSVLAPRTDGTRRAGAYAPLSVLVDPESTPNDPNRIINCAFGVIDEPLLVVNDRKRITFVHHAKSTAGIRSLMMLFESIFVLGASSMVLGASPELPWG
ncbi:MAG TPA: hypothetical protein VGO11_04165 [Chthoniobacteraceae bacterium]|nr:hypothetical protein [Chthoniobacteraceae bacterium]